MKIDRLIGILSILLQKEKVTASELAQVFEVSKRTIHRDIDDLCRAGIPIVTSQGTGGGISIMGGYRMDRTILSSKDMQMILAGLRSLDSASGSHYYSQLMEKLKAGSAKFVSGSESILIEEYGTESFTELLDGRLLLECDYADDESVLSWMLTMRDKATVLEPADIR